MALDSPSALIQSRRISLKIQCSLLNLEGLKWHHNSVHLDKPMFSCVNLNRCDRSSDYLLWWCHKVFHSLYFVKKPSCWLSSPTAINKTSLITFASDSVSLFGPVAISGGQLFWSCNHLSPDHQSEGTFYVLHPVDATSAEFFSVGTYRHRM